MERLEAVKNVLVLGCVFLMLFLFTYFEKEVFISSAYTVIRTGPLMAALIFAHNSLVATCVAVGMLFAVNLSGAMPERFRRRPVLRHPRLFSWSFAVLLEFGSAMRFGGLNALNALPIFLPVAAVEAYGLYLATLAGLRRCVSMKSVAKVYAVFLFGAILETYLIIFV